MPLTFQNELLRQYLNIKNNNIKKNKQTKTLLIKIAMNFVKKNLNTKWTLFWKILISIFCLYIYIYIHINKYIIFFLLV